eukprot:UN08376
MNRIRMPENRYQLPLNEMIGDGPLYYIPAKENNKKDIEELTAFDIQHNISAIISNDNTGPIVEAFGEQVAKSAVELFGIHDANRILLRLSDVEIENIRQHGLDVAFDMICNEMFDQ